ncbi:MAG: hydantoinase B/oxoprolinase family protein [Actinobacteria bacterium]|nr:hydantoinase B/oxoprolinase family protein [Actinomycetota bacterium]MBU1945092.1 hydantoinase B/oxoprolinase family protein [Actinomycetota bacterium]MBU2688361.1 hydantoinase B/oxoprolinase family protein [Actinomycetota bacterium]
MGGRDLDMSDMITPEPPTVDEVRCMEALSPADLEILGHRMQMIALEANEVLMRMSGSPAGLAGDIGSCVYTAEGDPAAAAVGIWGHAFAGQLPIKYILKHYADDPSVGIHDGDAFFCNEALFGGIHPPDMGTFMPIFHEGRLIAWAESMVHATDTGAIEMGGIAMNAKTRYDEGLKMAPMKLAENFMIKGDVATMMENMVRDQASLALDNKARLAACMRIRQRVLEVAEKKGADAVVGCLRRMIEEGARVARERVAALNDGTYRQPVFMNLERPESQGGGEQLVRIMLSIRKKGDRITADFSGTSPEAESPLNLYSHVIHPFGTGYVCCSHLFPDLPPSLGLTEIVDLVVEPGSMVCPGEEAAVGACPATAFAASQAIFCCIARMMFDSDLRENLVSTYPYMTLYAVWGGLDRKGNYFVSFGADINAGGFPARSDMDGVDTAGFNVATRSDCGEVEDADIIQGMSYLFRRQGTDNFGHGMYRGGAGIEFAYLAHKSMMTVLACVGGCGKFSSAPGIFGGYSVPPLIGVKVQGSNILDMFERGDENLPTSIEEVLRSRDVLGGTCRVSSPMLEMAGLDEGDFFATLQGGGAGYGDAIEREPEAVARDVEAGLVSGWAARNVYKLVYDPETFIVDEAATGELRLAAREERKRRGRPYEEFALEWDAKRPEGVGLDYYGSWPDCM